MQISPLLYWTNRCHARNRKIACTLQLQYMAQQTGLHNSSLHDTVQRSLTRSSYLSVDSTA